MPHIMLVDAKGNIVFKGDPASRPDLVKDLNELLEGKVPEGCTAPYAGGDGPAMPEFKGGEYDLEDIFTFTDEFASEGYKQLQADCKSDVEGFSRAFCVMTTAVSLDAKDDPFKTDFKSYHILVGPGDKVDAVND